METFREESQPIEFVVGETYENEKGVFEVLSIQRDAMVIQWENGESIETTVSFQRRIQERRRWERQRREKLAAAAGAKGRRAARKAGTSFQGFRPEDFKKTISRTPWRSRSQFGGAVTARLPSSRLSFNSWAAKRRNEVYWADVNYWKAKTVDYPAKFCARADETTLSWGFYIERAEADRMASPDWEAFMKWLGVVDNDNWLREAALEHDLQIYDTHQRTFGGIIKPQAKGWAVDDGTTSSETATLAAFIETWPAGTWIDLMMAKRITKEDAIERGKDMAADVAALIDKLFPLYEASVSPPS
jgi:hypothetical protein